LVARRGGKEETPFDRSHTVLLCVILHLFSHCHRHSLSGVHSLGIRTRGCLCSRVVPFLARFGCFGCFGCFRCFGSPLSLSLSQFEHLVTCHTSHVPRARARGRKLRKLALALSLALGYCPIAVRQLVAARLSERVAPRQRDRVVDISRGLAHSRCDALTIDRSINDETEIGRSRGCGVPRRQTTLSSSPRQSAIIRAADGCADGDGRNPRSAPSDRKR